MALVYLWSTSLVIGHLLALGVLLYGVQHGVTSLSWAAVLRLLPLRRATRPGRHPAGSKAKFSKSGSGYQKDATLDVLQVRLLDAVTGSQSQPRRSHAVEVPHSSRM